MQIFCTLYAAMMWGSMTDGPCSVLINAPSTDWRGINGGKGIFLCDGTRRGANSGPFRVASLPSRYSEVHSNA